MNWILGMGRARACRALATAASISAVLLASSPGRAASLWQELISSNEEASGGFGYTVAGVPDVNGDGFGDIVVGARREDPGASPTDAGRAYIVDGVSGAILQTLVSPNELNTGLFGSAVDGVPDLTGDGRGDVVVGAFQERVTTTLEGRAYVFNGATGALVHSLISPTIETGGNFGTSVAGIPDCTGDGLGDIVIGADAEDPGASPAEAGRAHIFNGATGVLHATLVSPNEQSNGVFGTSVAGLSDITGDGLGDVMVGAFQEDSGGSPSTSGRVHLYNGSTGALIDTLVSPNESAQGFFGWDVSGVPDCTGDGIMDLLVGAYGEGTVTFPAHGRAYIFNGATRAALHTLEPPTFEFLDGSFGRSVAGVEDFTGDGLGEAIVGAPSYDPGSAPAEAGRAYLYNGSTGVLITTLVSPNEQASGLFGNEFGVGGVSDVTGDGLGDVVVGAPNEESGASPGEAGRAYIFSTDTFAPEVDAVDAVTSQSVDITFNELMGAGSTTAANYAISGTGQGTLAANPDSVTDLGGGVFRLTWLSGSQTLGGDVTITVTGVEDNSGNPIGANNSATDVGGGLPVALSEFGLE